MSAVVPSEIARLTKLTSLELERATLSSVMTPPPAELYTMTNLRILTIGNGAFQLKKYDANIQRLTRKTTTFLMLFSPAAQFARIDRAHAERQLLVRDTAAERDDGRERVPAAQVAVALWRDALGHAHRPAPLAVGALFEL